MIGPHRGGRTIAVSGIEGQPNVYYFGGVAGGVWKTTNAGRTWAPVFDSQPIASIGALALAPSDPKIIYVGSGEGDLRSDITYGDGVYKSADGGKTWTNIGLRDTRQIGRIIVDPHDPKIVLVAALGHAYGPNPERGVFRSIDGGATWQKTLYKDENTGAIDIAFDPDDSRTIYAGLWSARRPPWSSYPPINGSGALYRSTDGGVTWKQITGGGLPASDWGRVGIAIARGTHGQRVYALIDGKESGLYRSDDGAKTWTRVGADRRVLGRLWYFGEVDVDPNNPDIVYLSNVSLYRSSDGGKTFTALKGAPGGDDYHALWIDPSNSERMIFGSDQGAGISVDGGKSWTSWYNQPTAQFYHVAVDNEFPYRVYGAQQDSGTAAVISRSDYGQITFRDWYTIGAGESGYIAPDPGDANTVYGGSTYGELFRFDRRTGQTQNISPVPQGSFGTEIYKAGLRFTWTSPLVFSPQDSQPHTLYFGSQFLLRSRDRGMSWEKISPDLTGSVAGTQQSGPPTVANAKARGYGVIYTIAPSPVNAEQIWVGTDTGLVQLTRDGGKTWTNVSPPISDWSKISILDASHFDAGTAYAAVDRHRLDDVAPSIYRTHDFGKTWNKITEGIPNGAYVRTVREDPARKGLLFAGTELGVYFSIDDGDHWQSLQVNMPAVPVHDLVIKDDDVVAATHGRAFWILDDITPLRQITNEAFADDERLFKPATAIRIRRNVNTDTPLPPETPAGENPPTGVIVYYWLKSAAQGDVTLEVLDSGGNVIRRYSSGDRPAALATPPPFPDYWFRPPLQLSNEAGMHRFVWDFRYAPPPVSFPSYSMATASGQSTPVEPEGPQVLPGTYQLRLTANGRTLAQAATVVMDPRVKTSSEDLEKQFALQMRIVEALRQGNQSLQEIRAERRQIASGADKTLDRKLATLAGGARGEDGEEPSQPGAPSLTRVNATLARLATVVDGSDAAPTTQSVAATEEALTQLKALLAQWEELKRQQH